MSQEPSDYLSPPRIRQLAIARCLPTIDTTRRRGSGMVQGTRRYDRLAEQYSQYRPRYPDQLISHLADIIAKAPASNLVVNVGSGTGIFTRQLRGALPDAMRIVGNRAQPLNARTGRRSPKPLTTPASPSVMGLQNICPSWAMRPGQSLPQPQRTGSIARRSTRRRAAYSTRRRRRYCRIVRDRAGSRIAAALIEFTDDNC
jgi:hypothetical protein